MSEVKVRRRWDMDRHTTMANAIIRDLRCAAVKGRAMLVLQETAQGGGQNDAIRTRKQAAAIYNTQAGAQHVDWAVTNMRYDRLSSEPVLP